jgi:hypothetical protein
VYERLSTVTPPAQRPDYVDRARVHRAAAEKERASERATVDLRFDAR